MPPNPDALPPEVLSCYERGGETVRLDEGNGRLEFLRTWYILSRVLPPPPAQVLDVGGATGKQVIDADDGPKILVILDESVLGRVVGGPRMMAEQLEALLALAARPNIKVRVVPLEDGALIGALGSFVVLNLSEDDVEDAVVYVEGGLRDQIVHDRAEVRFHRDIFETLWRNSFDDESSFRRIDLEARRLRVRLDENQ